MGVDRSRRRSWLLLQGLWWRRGFSASVLVVGALVIGAAVLGPLYARAAGESTLRDELTQAGSATGLEFQDMPSVLQLTAPISQFAQAQAKTPTPGAVHGYPTRTGSIYVQTFADARGVPPSVRVGMLWRDGACAHLIIVTGQCPSGPGQVLVSQRTLDNDYGWRLGGRITFAAGPRLQIVGTYTPRDPHEAFWFGHDYFEAFQGTDGPDTVDAVFVDRDETAAFQPSTQATLLWDYPLDQAAIRLNDVPRLRRDVAGLQRRYHTASSCGVACPGQQVNWRMSTDLVKVLDAAAHERNLVDRGTLLVTLQLALLAWLVLFEVVTDAVESRGNEIALAKLRGLRPWRTAWFAVGEPLVLLAVAAAIGLGLGWLAARLFSSAVLAPHTPVVLTWSAAAAGLVVLLTGSAHRTAVAALLVPGLLVMAVALLGTRLLPLLARTLLRPTRASDRIG